MLLLFICIITITTVNIIINTKVSTGSVVKARVNTTLPSPFPATASAATEEAFG